MMLSNFCLNRILIILLGHEGESKSSGIEEMNVHVLYGIFFYAAGEGGVVMSLTEIQSSLEYCSLHLGEMHELQ